VRHHTRRVGFVLTANSASFVVTNEPDDQPLDLLEIRRQITVMRSQNSDNLLITSLLNRFLVKIAFLSEPTDFSHAQHLRSEFARTLQRVEAITSRTPSAKSSSAVKQPK
jgi:hypothetical protein